MQSFIQCILANAIPDVAAKIASQKTTAIRQFSTQFEKWVAESIKSYSAELVQQKTDGKVLRGFGSKHNITLVNRVHFQWPKYLCPSYGIVF